MNYNINVLKNKIPVSHIKTIGIQQQFQITFKPNIINSSGFTIS